MSNETDKHPCARCGVKTSAEFCLDCRRVDPDMTAGGLTAKQMADIRKARTAAERQHTAAMYRVAGYSTRGQRRDSAA